MMPIMANLTLNFQQNLIFTLSLLLLLLLALLNLTNFYFYNYFTKGPQAGSRTSPPELSFKR